MTDKQLMQKAIELALKGTGKTNPNPLVGAVVVKDNVIIGMGYHEKFGKLHAERNALNNCIISPKDATMYVTLEPCSHYGKTPPCTEAIIESGITKVVVGCLDPNEKVSGKGIAKLQNAGIEVIIGVMEDQCKRINEIFFHYITHKTPYVLMKYAMTQDGKIATITGSSKWITNELSRENVHATRNKYSSIMVGVGTILADNPDLTCRLNGGRNPIRIICDSNLLTPLNSKVITTAKEIKTIIATINTNKSLQNAYLDMGVELISTTPQGGKVNLTELMHILGNKGIDSILLEGGASLNFSALESEIVQKIQCYIAPKLFGGIAKTPIEGKGFEDVSNKICLKNREIFTFNDDIMIESEVYYVHWNS